MRAAGSPLLRRSEVGLRNAVGPRLAGRIAIAPLYDAAYAGVADAWNLLASYGMERVAERRDGARARDYARAVRWRINPRSGEAYASLGRTIMLADWDWTLSEIALQEGDRARTRATRRRVNGTRICSARSGSEHARSRAVRRNARFAEQRSALVELNAGNQRRESRNADPNSHAACACVGMLTGTPATLVAKSVLEVDPDFAQYWVANLSLDRWATAGQATRRRSRGLRRRMSTPRFAARDDPMPLA